MVQKSMTQPSVVSVSRCSCVYISLAVTSPKKWHLKQGEIRRGTPGTAPLLASFLDVEDFLATKPLCKQAAVAADRSYRGCSPALR